MRIPNLFDHGSGIRDGKIRIRDQIFTRIGLLVPYDQCCGSGSGILCLFDPGPGSGKCSFPDPGSRIPTPYFLELSDKFLGKKFCKSFKIGPKFFSSALKK